MINNGNDYLVAVKENQPKLFDALQTQFEQAQQMDANTQVEYTRDREVERIVSVLERPSTIGQQWVGVERIVRVERFGTRAGEPFDETVFYISSLKETAAEFAGRIRNHWLIENCLHWPKDMVLEEDSSPLCDGYALVNFGSFARLR